MRSLIKIHQIANYVHSMYCTSKETCSYDDTWQNSESENNLVFAKICAASKKLNIPVFDFITLLKSNDETNNNAKMLKEELASSFRNF